MLLKFIFKPQLSKVLIISSLFLFSSCATLFSPSREVPALTITSSVPDAEVYLNGKYVGKTPYSHFGDKVNVKKIMVKKDGYKPAKQKARKLDKNVYLNFLPSITFIWGFFVDLYCESLYYYPKDVFHFILEKNK